MNNILKHIIRHKPALILLFLALVLINSHAFSQSHQRTEIGYKMLDLEKEGGFLIDTTAYLILDSIMNDAEKEITFKEKYTKEEAIDLLERFHKILKNYKITYDTLHTYSQALLERKFDCKFYSLTYLSIGERFKLPIYTNLAPSHIFIEWKNINLNFYWETTFGYESTKELYIDSLNISKESIKNGYYFQRISKLEDPFIIYFCSGQANYNNKKYINALEDYNRVIKIYPKHSETYHNCGIVKEKLGKIKEAIQDYNRSIEINPNYTEVYYCLGNIKCKLYSFKEAIKDYTKALEINPEYVDAYFNRGFAKSKLGNYKEAIKDFTKAIEINSNYYEAYYNRGVTKKKLGNNKGAIQDYTMAIEINPNFAEAYYNRSIVKTNLSDIKGAIEDCTKAIEINPNFADVYCYRGISKTKLNDYKGAIQDYTRAIEINPKYAGAYYNRGISKSNIGDDNGACQDWKKALELGYMKAKELIKKNCK